MQGSEKKDLLLKFSTKINCLEPNKVKTFLLDCRKPRSKEMRTFKKQISTWTRFSPPCKLSNEASLLLGLFEKYFSNVTACSIMEHILIKLCELCLPEKSKDLYDTLSELRDVGILMLFGDRNSDNCIILLNFLKFTNEVHKLLFSKSAIERLKQKYSSVHNTPFNIGILPESVLMQRDPASLHHKAMPNYPSILPRNKY